MLSVALLSSTILTVSPTEAAAKVKKPSLETSQESLAETEIPSTSFTYEYEGITFSYPTELDENQLQDMYEVIMDPTEYVSTEYSVNAPYKGSMVSKIDDGPSRAVVLPPGGAQVTTGPYYITYTNRDARAVITAASAFVGGKLKIASATAKWLVTGALTKGTFDLTEFIGPTYVGTWNYKAYDSYQGRYRTYSTVVHYKYGNYTSPKTVQTYPLN